MKRNKSEKIKIAINTDIYRQTQTEKVRTPSMADVGNPALDMYTSPTKATNPNYVRCKVAPEPFD